MIGRRLRHRDNETDSEKERQMYDEPAAVDYIIMRHISSHDMQACQEQAQESTPPGTCYVAVSVSDGFTTDGELDDDDDDDDYDVDVEQDGNSANSFRDIVRSATSSVDAVSCGNGMSSANGVSSANGLSSAIARSSDGEVSCSNEVSCADEVSSADGSRSSRNDLVVVADVSNRDDTDDNSAASTEL